MRSGLGWRYHLCPPERTLHLCRSAHECLHAYNKKLAFESAFDASSDVETLGRSITPKHSGDSSFGIKACSIFQMLISHCFGNLMALRFQFPGEGVLGRTDMLKDSSARSRKKKFISTPMRTSTKRGPALGILPNRCPIRNARTQHSGI